MFGAQQSAQLLFADLLTLQRGAGLASKDLRHSQMMITKIHSATRETEEKTRIKQKVSHRDQEEQRKRWATNKMTEKTR